MLLRVAACCSVLQRVTAGCSVWQRVALQQVETHVAVMMLRTCADLITSALGLLVQGGADAYDALSL